MKERVEKLRRLIADKYYRFRAYKVSEEDGGLMFDGPYAVTKRPKAVSFFPVLRSNPWDFVYWDSENEVLMVHFRYDTFYYLSEDLALERLNEGVTIGKINSNGYYDRVGNFVSMPLPEWEFVFRLYHHLRKRIMRPNTEHVDRRVLGDLSYAVFFDPYVIREYRAIELSLSEDAKRLRLAVLENDVEGFVSEALSLLPLLKV